MAVKKSRPASRAAAGKSPRSAPTIPNLPLTVVGIIAEWLIARNQHATCAALNLVSKHFHGETTPILWRRVVYRFDNGPKNKKKVGVQWRTIFGSTPAQHIQYLVVIPLVEPALYSRTVTWEPPFLSIITSRDNALKVCLLPSGAMLSVTLFANYQPCSTDLCEMMACAEMLRRITKATYPCADVQLYKRSKTDDEGHIEDDDLKSAFENQRNNVKAWSLTPAPLYEIRLFLTHHDNVGDSYIGRLSVDFINWQGLPLYVPSGYGRMMGSSLFLTVNGLSFNAALAFGQSLRIAYESDPRLACMFVRASTREPISVEQAKGFTRTIEPCYIRAIPHLLNGKHSGGVIIQDTSNASKRRNPGPDMQPVFLSLGYDIVGRDSVPRIAPTVEAFRRIQPDGGAPAIKERIYLERGCGDGGPLDRQMEEVLERLSLPSGIGYDDDLHGVRQPMPTFLVTQLVIISPTIAPTTS